MMDQTHHRVRSDGFENFDTPTVQARMPSQPGQKCDGPIGQGGGHEHGNAMEEKA